MRILILLFSFVTFMANAQSQLGEKIYKEGKFTYPNGKMKALILSYDDGLMQDSIMVTILNKHDIKGTFNLNSAFWGEDAVWLNTLIGKSGKYLNKEQVKRIYKGHEIAAHTHSHPHLPELNKEQIEFEISSNIKELSALRETDIVSFAYPFGEYNEKVIEILKPTRITNARTVNDTKDFDLPDNYYVWNPTCHHTLADNLVAEFVSKKAIKPILFHIWGHSWEFDGNQKNNNWLYFDNMCNKLSKKEDVWYVSAGEFVEYVNAIRSLSEEDGIINNSNLVLWLKVNGKLEKLHPKEELPPN